jgi:signal transduction histidine kinase
VQSLAALAPSTESDPALATLLQRLDHLAREVARRERQLASDDFEDRLLYLRQEAELADANAKAEAARFRAEGADRSARLSIGIAVISIVALFGMGYLALLVRRAARGVAEADQRRVQAMLRVSHDLRNPINGILGLCAALRTTSLPPESGKSVDAIASAAHSLVSLAQDLLDHGQLEARKLRLETRPIDLPSTLRHLARQYESRCADAGLAFQVELDPGLPRRASLDADRLTQVLGNLLGNALKFTPEGRITLVAKVVRRVEHIHVITFEVHDTGPGIAEAERERLMLPFEKGSSGKLHASGAGLGLAISSNLAALMGGRLQLNSKPGAGAIFHFTLSLEALPDVPSYRGASHSLTAVASSRQVQRVLVVDDDALNREYHGLLLSAQSFDPTLAADAEQAVEHARSVDFDAALIDLDMTGASGAELAVRLRDAARTKRRPIRLVMVSGYPPSRELGSETVDAWLLKPLTPAALRDALRADAA